MGKFLAVAEDPSDAQDKRELRVRKYKHLLALVPVRAMPLRVTGTEIALLPVRRSVYIL